MKEAELFAAALNLKEPWFVRRIEFPEVDDGEIELHIEVDHAKRSKFEYEGNSYPVYDHQYRSWRHLQFFNMIAFCTLEFLELKQMKVPYV